MDAEGMIAFGIIVYCALIFMIIGIVQRKSKEPVGFYTGVKPPRKEDVTDITSYNKQHGLMWILLAILMIVAFWIGQLIRCAWIQALILIGTICGALVAMIWYHHYLYRKYVMTQEEHRK